MSKSTAEREVTVEAAAQSLFITHGSVRGAWEAEDRIKAARKSKNEQAERFWQAVHFLVANREEP